MHRTGNRHRANSSTPILERSQKPSHTIRGNDADNGGDDSSNRNGDIMLSIFAAMSEADKATRPAAPAFATIPLDDALQHKLTRCKRKMDLATSRLTSTIKRGDNTRQARLQLDAATDAYEALYRGTDPAYLLNQINDDETRRVYASYQHDWQAYQKNTKEGGHKHLYNLAAGGVGNFLCFGLGGIAGTCTGSTALALIINTVAWTCAEPLISMMRATSVNNPYLDFYMARQHLQARAVREYIDGTASLERNRKFPWSAAGSKDTEWLSAGEWLERSSWRGLWAGKHFTDDLIYHVYSAAYGLTNCLPEFLGETLYDASTWRGKLAYAGIRTAGGFVAGAVIQEGMQLLRADAMEHTGGKETVTKPRAFWQREAHYIGLLLDRIDARLAGHGLDQAEKITLQKLHDSLTLWHRKAVAKSSLLRSLAYEWRVMLQPKRKAVGIDPEVPGKRLDTVASLIGKGACQLPGILVASTVGSVATRSSLAWARWAGYLVPPLAAIGWGFSFRREFEVVARTMLGAAQGAARRCCGAPEQDEEGI